MARRNGRLGDHLATSDYSGCTEYASRLVYDYWGALGTAQEILKRNLQEIASPLGDPYPVSLYRGAQYEQTTPCDFETQPLFIGNTTVPFPQTQYTQLFGLDPGIGDASIGCTFVVHPDGPSVGNWELEGGGFFELEDGGLFELETA